MALNGLLYVDMPLRTYSITIMFFTKKWPHATEQCER